MATEKNITMKEFNGTDYDTLYPKTIASQIPDVYSKTEILTTETLAKYGFTADKLPNDVFQQIKTLIDNTQQSVESRAKIQTGSYVGTSTYGVSNPCSITFDFVPESLIIYSSATTTTNNYCVPFSFIHVSSVTNSYSSGQSFIVMGYQNIQFKSMFVLQLKLINKTIYWYASSDYDQLNINGQVYKWIALG